MSWTVSAVVLGAVWLAPVDDQEEEFFKNARRAADRDAFPVFTLPDLIPAAVAEEKGIVGAGDLILGIANQGEAKAYPIAVMGSHELGNDTIGGVPIAVSW
jgi:hypothetical protein